MTNHQPIQFVEYIAWNTCQYSLFKKISTETNCVVDVTYVYPIFNDFRIQIASSLPNTTTLDYPNVCSLLNTFQSPEIYVNMCDGTTIDINMNGTITKIEISARESDVEHVVTRNFSFPKQLKILKIDYNLFDLSKRVPWGDFMAIARRNSILEHPIVDERISASYERVRAVVHDVHKTLNSFWLNVLKTPNEPDFQNFSFLFGSYDIEVGRVRPCERDSLPRPNNGFVQCICSRMAPFCRVPDTSKKVDIQFVYLPEVISKYGEDYVKEWINRMREAQMWSPHNITYLFSNELDMLECFMRTFCSYVDISIGYNTSNFDNPFIVNRINFLKYGLRALFETNSHKYLLYQFKNWQNSLTEHFCGQIIKSVHFYCPYDHQPISEEESCQNASKHIKYITQDTEEEAETIYATTSNSCVYYRVHKKLTTQRCLNDIVIPKIILDSKEKKLDYSMRIKCSRCLRHVRPMDFSDEFDVEMTSDKRRDRIDITPLRQHIDMCMYIEKLIPNITSKTLENASLIAFAYQIDQTKSTLIAANTPENFVSIMLKKSLVNEQELRDFMEIYILGIRTIVYRIMPVSKVPDIFFEANLIGITITTSSNETFQINLLNGYETNYECFDALVNKASNHTYPLKVKLMLKHDARTNVERIFDDELKTIPMSISIGKTSEISRSIQMNWKTMSDAIETVYYCFLDSFLTFYLDVKFKQSINMFSAPLLKLFPYDIIFSPSGKKVIFQYSSVLSKEKFAAQITSPWQIRLYFNSALAVEGLFLCLFSCVFIFFLSIFLFFK